ncbi:4Fe-4S single cluster domain-containing protein [Lachnospiraceae bacterium C7]|nr:4Fe-4S single cluster domain-containing protein [Lachnospiraceae bacterium C7]
MKNDDEEMVKYIVNAIRCSLFWDESWYKKTYNISDDINALNHYIVEGYKMGYDPSPLFSGEKYYENNPDVKSEGINPLVHYELFGVEENRKYKVDTHEMLEFFKNKYPHLRMKLDGGIIRVRVTDKCNAKCRYCGLRVGVLGECHEHMNPDWYMRLFRPIYEKVDQVLLTGGDPFVCKESYSLMEMLGKEYPHLNVLVETNGMMLNEKYRALLSECLYTIHVSLNASNRKVFQESCWEGDGGEVFFDKVQENLKKYVALLESRDMLCFAPGYSMVINKDNYYDVIDFAKLALSLKGKYITYYFDYTENDMLASYFTNPEIMRPTLKKLMEIERVLARYILVTFRLWIPNKEAETIQKEVDEETDAELQKNMRTF